MEIWKNVKNFERYLEISNYGRLRRLERRVSVNGGIYVRKERLANLSICTQGYKHSSIKINKKRYNFLIHRLVADHFLVKLPGCTEVNHKDGIKVNNHEDNLEWVSRSTNMNHASKYKLSRTGEDHPNNKLTEAQVREIRSSNKTYYALAKIYNVSQSNIRAICIYKTWKYID